MYLPDLTPLFYLAMFGLVCAVLVVLGGGSWLGYHLFLALRSYLS